MEKKILFITPSLSKGGAETQMCKLACHLKNQGYEIFIISLIPRVNYSIDLSKSGIRELYLKGWKSNFIWNLRTLNKAVKEFNPPTVIAFMFIAIVFARLLKLKYRFKLISSIRAATIPTKWHLPFKATQLLDDAVVYNAPAAKESFERRNLVKKEGIIINNAIHLPVLEAAEGHSHAESSFRWICVAHFRHEKDYPTLFKAIARLKDRKFTIDIIGNLFDQDWPFNTIEELGIENKVTLHGFKTDAGHYLRQADAFVVSSFTESMPNAILEAMAYQKPIVSTAVGGVEQLITSAQSGFCFRQGHVEELAGLMEKVMDLPVEEREVLGANGRKHVEQHFSEERVMDKWIGLIQSKTLNVLAPKAELISE